MLCITIHWRQCSLMGSTSPPEESQSQLSGPGLVTWVQASSWWLLLSLVRVSRSSHAPHTHYCQTWIIEVKNQEPTSSIDWFYSTRLYYLIINEISWIFKFRYLKKNREVEKNGFKIYFDSKSRYKHFMIIALNRVDNIKFYDKSIETPCISCFYSFHWKLY